MKYLKGYTPWNKGEKVNKTCLFCKKDYEVHPYRSSISKFCSHLCYSKHKKTVIVPMERIQPMLNANKNRIYQKHTAEAKKKMSASRQGLSLSDWKGYKTSGEKLERMKFRIEVQKKVLERDNYTCQLCGEKGVNLQVDHIQPWSEYVELRFDINNCRTLCMKCHYKVTFGKEMPNKITWGNNLSKIIYHNLKEEL